jgi:hypothetical protein
VLKHFSITPPENSSGAEKSTENSGSHAKNFFCSMYEMSQRHPVWVAENHVNPYNSARTASSITLILKKTGYTIYFSSILNTIFKVHRSSFVGAADPLYQLF